MRELKGTANPAVVIYTADETQTYVVQVYWWVDDVTYDLNLEVTGPQKRPAALRLPHRVLGWHQGCWRLVTAT